jgi:NAD(P)-dependent dehydrogenase (short-subunit alcohol dehydrogenase family)
MSTAGLITTPFGFESTAADVVAGSDLSGKHAIVTGGSSGIGVETARALAGAGAAVTLAVRDPDAGRKTAAQIIVSTGNPKVYVHELDLADPESIAAFVRCWKGPLDILINNAGVMALPELQLTPRGWELQFATNHLGHFALAVGLHDALSRARDGARVASLSSRGHRRAPVDFEDINFADRPYEPMIAYGQSKTANVLFAVDAQRRWADDGITANAVHPGAIAATNLTRHMDPAILEGIVASGVYRLKTPEQGATSVLVATWPQLDGTGGRYFEDANESPVVEPDATARSSSTSASTRCMPAVQARVP